MKTKATITIDPNILEQARGLAKKRQSNVSRLIGELITREVARDRDQVDQLIGSASLRESSNDPRLDHLIKKHVC